VAWECGVRLRTSAARRGGRLWVDFGAALFAFKTGNFIAEALDFVRRGTELPGLLIHQIQQAYNERTGYGVGNGGGVNLVQHAPIVPDCSVPCYPPFSELILENRY
jgi:hypothetical protein